VSRGGTLALAGHSLRRTGPLVLVIGVILAVFQVLSTLMAATFFELRTFERITALIPPFVREFLGNSLFGVFSFAGIACIGYFHVAVTAALIVLAIAIGTEPAAEVERGFLDLVLSRPIRRHAVINRTVLLLAACTAFVLLLMLAGTWIGLRFFAPPGAVWPTPRLVLSLAVSLWALALCWGGIASAVGARARRRSLAGAITGAAALTLFLADYVARAWKPLAQVAKLSPFHYYNAMELVAGRPLPLANLWILGGTAIAGVALAYVLFSRRDL
jgi:ABC-2 type transport system permease protein